MSPFVELQWRFICSTSCTPNSSTCLRHVNLWLYYIFSLVIYALLGSLHYPDGLLLHSIRLPAWFREDSLFCRLSPDFHIRLWQKHVFCYIHYEQPRPLVQIFTATGCHSYAPPFIIHIITDWRPKPAFPQILIKGYFFGVFITSYRTACFSHFFLLSLIVRHTRGC